MSGAIAPQSRGEGETRLQAAQSPAWHTVAAPAGCSQAGEERRVRAGPEDTLRGSGLHFSSCTSVIRTEQQIPQAPCPPELGGVRVAMETGQGVTVPVTTGPCGHPVHLVTSKKGPCHPTGKNSLGQEGLFVCSCVCAPCLPWQAELAVCVVGQRTGLARLG